MRRVLVVMLVTLLLAATVVPVAAQDVGSPDQPGQKQNLFMPLLQSSGVDAVSAAKSGGVRAGDPTAPGAPRFKSTKNVYIVGMIEAPVVAYKGGIPGFKATKPGKGQKIDPNSPEVVKYVGFLDSRHDQVLNSVGGGRKLYHYRYAFNGFAAELTDAQVAALAGNPSVISVERDSLRIARHLLHPRVPRPECAGRAVGAIGRRRQCR